MLHKIKKVFDLFLCYFKAKSKSCNTNEKSYGNDCVHEGPPVKSQPPLIAKWRNGVKLQLTGKFDGDGKVYIFIYSFISNIRM